MTFASCERQGDYEMSRIPKILHYIFGMERDFGGKPWSLVHHVCLKSAIERLCPDQVFFYYEFEPRGPWWKLSRELVTSVIVEAPREIFGRPLVHFAHRSDVLRLQKLIDHGGIYLDADVIVHRDFDDLLGHSVVLGQEGEAAKFGLANAVLLAEPQSAFLHRWLEQYKSFRSVGYDEAYPEHGVRLPSKLARDYPDEVTVLSHEAFHWPLWTDQHLEWIFASTREIPLNTAYATHLWQSRAWRRYMEDLTPGRVRSADTNFNRWAEPLVVGLPDDYGATPLADRFWRLQKRALKKARRVCARAAGKREWDVR
jgi:Glycosyltransferase sugar-binding region containing DXD motif